MQDRSVVTSQFLCRRVQCGDAMQLRNSLNGLLLELQHTLQKSQLYYIMKPV